MPYPIELLDPQIVEYYANATATPTFPVGQNFRQGDMRVIGYFGQGGDPTTTGTTDVTRQYPNVNTPAGWTRRTNGTVQFSYNLAGGGSNTYIYSVPTFTRVLQDGDTDFTATVAGTGLVQPWIWAVTVRNPNVGQSWSVGTNVSSNVWEYQTNNAYTSTMNHPSLSVVANSVLLLFDVCEQVGYTTGPNVPLLIPPSSVTKLTENINIVTGTSNSAIYEQILSQGYSSGGSSGTLQSVIGNTSLSPPSPQAIGSFYASTAIVLTQNPDVSASVGTAAATTASAGTTTAALQNLTTFPLATAAAEVDTAGAMATPLAGIRTSPPLALPQSPITSSLIHWDEVTLGFGSTVTVETTVDGGLTWQVAANDQPIPRLLTGYNVFTTVQTRVTLKRLLITDPTPRVSNLEVRVATNASNNELVSLGVFSINNTKVTLTGGASGGSSGGSGGGGSGVTGSGGGASGAGRVIEISGVDLSRLVARNSWEDVYFIAAGTNYADAIMEIIEDRLPGTSYNFASTTHVTPKLVFGTQMDADPWQDAQDLATAIGMELFFDAQGVCTLRDVPDPGTGQSVWTFSDAANPTITQITRNLTDQTVFNYVVAYGESVDNKAPVSAVAYDNDPNSPTYYLGNYGKVPTSYTSPQITTTAQAQAAADALLNASIGSSENVQLSTVPNPALEPGDVVTVVVDGVKITGTFMINDMNTPLSAASEQSFTVYRQTN